MKRLFIILFSLLLCNVSYADTYTMDWYMDGESYAQTTCQTGDDIILPQTPYKYGYTFDGWWGYTPIEYIESTGTQWIDTGLTNEDTDEYYVKFYAEYLQYGFIFGNYQSESHECTRLLFTESDNSHMYSNIGSMASRANENNYFIPGSWNEAHGWRSRNTVYFIMNNNEGGSSKGFESGTFNDNTIALFASSPTGSKIPAKIAHIQFKLNNAIVCDMIPVLDIYGTPCMFDKVTGSFFYNQGTGDFIAGPVVSEQ